MAAENEERFARIVVANTGLPTGEERTSDAFMGSRHFVPQDVSGVTALGVPLASDSRKHRYRFFGPSV